MWRFRQGKHARLLALVGVLVVLLLALEGVEFGGEETEEEEEDTEEVAEPSLADDSAGGALSMPPRSVRETRKSKILLKKRGRRAPECVGNQEHGVKCAVENRHEKKGLLDVRQARRGQLAGEVFAPVPCFFASF